MRPRLAILASHPVQYYGPLYRELARSVDIEVLFAHRATPDGQAQAGFGVPFDWDVDITAGYRHSFLANVAAVPGTDRFSGCDTPEIRDRLRASGFDALLVHGWHLKSYLQGIIAARRLGLPVLVRGDSHLETPRSLLKRAAKRASFPALLRIFDAALYVGERSRAYYRHYGYPRSRLHFSPHCVDTAWFASRATPGARAELRQSLGVASETKLLLFAGKLMPLKRPLDLIAAAAICRSRGQDVAVLMAGDGELKRNMISAAYTAGVPLHDLGFRNQSEMPAVYAASDALVLPSEHETWGLVANEALACGRPIILSSGCGAAADLARDGRMGRVYAVGDVDGLAREIGAFIDAPSAPSAIRAVSAAYSLEAAAGGILKGLAAVTGNMR